MKEIKAHSREEKLDAVIRALRAAGARAVTAVRVVPLAQLAERADGGRDRVGAGDGAGRLPGYLCLVEGWKGHDMDRNALK
ncbi:MAG: hypothetical protein ACREU8_06985 [Gammaproteobacteria bacterium]